jgi:hypothetical protein
MLHLGVVEKFLTYDLSVTDRIEADLVHLHSLSRRLVRHRIGIRRQTGPHGARGPSPRRNESRDLRATTRAFPSQPRGPLFPVAQQALQRLPHLPRHPRKECLDGNLDRIHVISFQSYLLGKHAITQLRVTAGYKKLPRRAAVPGSFRGGVPGETFRALKR